MADVHQESMSRDAIAAYVVIWNLPGWSRTFLAHLKESTNGWIFRGVNHMAHEADERQIIKCFD